MLGQVELLAERRHQRQLRLQPVGVLLLALEDVLEEVAAAVVALGEAQLDARALLLLARLPPVVAVAQ